jgi:uncharacterized protein (DUF2062 family)
VKPCILIPCYNHVDTVAAVACAARKLAPVIVVDDGSTRPLPPLPDCTVVRLVRNSGKAEALRAGFQHATEAGYTHVITMDADGQHFAEDLPAFVALAREQPGALGVGVRDFHAAGCPTHRRRSNATSTFWFRVQTGVRLPDTQCGFRCYPLPVVGQLKVRTGRYAYELELMVRASWIGTPLVPIPVHCTYEPHQVRSSHFRPIRDLAHITLLGIGLVLQAWFVPLPLRMAWSRGERWSFGKAVHAFLADHAHDPLRLSLAVGLGLFFGIAPIWGYQMIAAATVAHWLRLNKIITLAASNISIPPMMPFILYGGLALGHWMFAGQCIDLSPDQMTRSRALEYLWQWAVGSVVLGVFVAAVGTALVYVAARFIRSSRRSHSATPVAEG